MYLMCILYYKMMIIFYLEFMLCPFLCTLQKLKIKYKIKMELTKMNKYNNHGIR